MAVVSNQQVYTKIEFGKTYNILKLPARLQCMTLNHKGRIENSFGLVLHGFVWLAYVFALAM